MNDLEKTEVVELEFDDNFAPLTDEQLDGLDWDFSLA